MTTLYEMKDKLATVGAQLQAIENQIIDKASNPSVPMSEVSELKNQKSDLQERFNLLKEQHDRMEQEQRASIQKQNPTAGAGNDAEKLVAAKAAYYRAVINGQPVDAKSLEILNSGPTPLVAIPTGGATSGEKFLPSTLLNQLVHEPFVKNPLRPHIGMSAIKGLELPKIAFSLDNEGFINDSTAAREIQLTGDKVTFGRFKFKVKARISDTVVHGSDLDLVNWVENALQSGLAAKEKKVSFADAQIVAAEKHMSLYEKDAQSAYLIKEVEGADLFEAITGAIADLDEDFRENAKVCMRRTDYVTMLKTLSNNSVALYGKQPEEIIGAPVVFSDAAAVPIIGDFKYMHLNYDPEMTFDVDKDVNTGDYVWVLTAWIDQRFLLRSAFRLAKVVDEQ